MNNEVTIRLLTSVNDLHQVAQINALLQAAYRSTQEFAAASESVESTLKRLREGECLLASWEQSLVGCLILRTHAKPTAPAWYRNGDVASFGRFAVLPKYQNQGVGSKLLDFAERRAKELGMKELALDTSESSETLIHFYQLKGYRLVDHHQWNATPYRSVVLSKTL